jgi:hypothetical protein
VTANRRPSVWTHLTYRLALLKFLIEKQEARVVDLGARARAMLDANFTRRQALVRWRDALDRVEQS